MTEVISLASEAGFGRRRESVTVERCCPRYRPDADRAKPTLDLDLENLTIERMLGVQWDVEKDAFLLKVLEPHQPPTKRGNSVSSKLAV